MYHPICLKDVTRDTDCVGSSLHDRCDPFAYQTLHFCSLPRTPLDWSPTP